MKGLITLLSSLCITLNVTLWSAFALGRCTWYYPLPVAKNEPYGIADVLELGLFFGIVASGALAFVLIVALFFVAKDRRKSTMVRLLVLLAVSGIGFLVRDYSLGRCGP